MQTSIVLLLISIGTLITANHGNKNVLDKNNLIITNHGNNNVQDKDTLITTSKSNNNEQDKNTTMTVKAEDRDLHITLELVINQNNLFDMSRNNTNVNLDYEDSYIDDIPLQGSPDLINDDLDADLTSYEDYYHQKHDALLLIHFLDMHYEGAPGYPNNNDTHFETDGFIHKGPEDYSLDEFPTPDYNIIVDNIKHDEPYPNDSPDQPYTEMPDYGDNEFVSTPFGPEENKKSNFWNEYFNSNLTDPNNFTYEEPNIDMVKEYTTQKNVNLKRIEDHAVEKHHHKKHPQTIKIY
uniref:Uncharacterized protein n=1 Tax=Cacopsylla melanoneura TaxID=428564 RepID=A0A8D9DYL0_9HEMI